MKTIWVCEICGNVATVEEGHTPDLEGCHEHNGRLGLHKCGILSVLRKKLPKKRGKLKKGGKRCLCRFTEDFGSWHSGYSESLRSVGLGVGVAWCVGSACLRAYHFFCDA